MCMRTYCAHETLEEFLLLSTTKIVTEDIGTVIVDFSLKHSLMSMSVCE